jgi:hypothetical protein
MTKKGIDVKFVTPETEFIPIEILVNIFNIYMFSGKSILNQYGKKGFEYDYEKKKYIPCNLQKKNGESIENENGSTIKIRHSQIFEKYKYKYEYYDTYEDENILDFYKNTMIISTFCSESCDTKKQLILSYNPNIYNTSLIEIRLVSKFWYKLFKIAILNRSNFFLDYHEFFEFKFTDNIPNCYFRKDIPTLINDGVVSIHKSNNFIRGCVNACLICRNLEKLSKISLYKNNWEIFKWKKKHSYNLARVELCSGLNNVVQYNNDTLLSFTISNTTESHLSIHNTQDLISNPKTENTGSIKNDKEDQRTLKLPEYGPKPYPNNEITFNIKTTNTKALLLTEYNKKVYFPVFFTVLGKIHIKDTENRHHLNFNGGEIIVIKSIVHLPCYVWLLEIFGKTNFEKWGSKDDNKKEIDVTEPFDEEFIELLNDINNNQIYEIYSAKIPF